LKITNDTAVGIVNRQRVRWLWTGWCKDLSLPHTI